MDATARALAQRHSLDRVLPAELLAALRLERWEHGERIIRAGDPVRHLRFLVQGRAKASLPLRNGESHLAAFFRPLEVLGEVELFSFERYSLDVQALTECTCLALGASAVRASAERGARLFMYLCGRLGTKLRARVTADAVNLRYPVATRLAGYLLDATDRRGWALGTDDLGEIASFLGASYRQLSRVVRRFRAEGILDRARGRIRVLDRARLVPLAVDRLP